ncbi:MAG: ABC transporter substrate-binding protein [Myxococcota bacterium]
MGLFRLIKLAAGPIILVMVFTAYLNNWQGCSSNRNQVVYRVGLSADYPPFEFQQNGQLVGFDVDLAHLIAHELEAKVVFQEMDFAGLIPSLQAGRIDMIISGVSRTPEREKNVDFSRPYYQNHLAAVTLQKELLATQKLEGKRLGAQLGTVMYEFVQQVPKASVVALSQHHQLLQALKSGHIDVLICEKAQAHAFQQSDPKLYYWLVGKVGTGYSVALAKQTKSTLRDQVDQAITQLQRSGKLDALQQKWLHAPIGDF